ncbi:MAG TPA: hypothetical protein VGR92_01670, partial [Steroidobacteraceae bacterium]|nr:hypothetical protein [Steroidobacteraceae bacterium]
ALEQIIKRGSNESHKHIQTILVRLFPQIAWAFGGVEQAPESYERWVKDLRICSPQMYDKYLHFSIDPNDISQADVDFLISVSGDRAQFREGLLKLHQRGLIAVVLNRLSANCVHRSMTDAIPE